MQENQRCPRVYIVSVQGGSWWTWSRSLLRISLQVQGCNVRDEPKEKKKSSTLHRFLRCRNTTCSLQSCNRLLRHPLSSMKHIPLQMFCANVFPKAIMAQTRPHIQTDRCVIFRVFPFSVFCLFMFRALLFLSSLPGQQKSFVRVARDASNGPNIAKQERSEN